MLRLPRDAPPVRKHVCPETGMALDLIAARLVHLDIFRGLSQAQVQRIAREAERMVFRDGQPLIKAADDGDGAILIVSGRAKALGDAELGLEEQELEAGSLLGEAAMVTEHRFRLTVVAAGDVRAVKLTRMAMQAHMIDDPGLADHFRGRIAARLQRVIVELKLIDERLAAASELLPAEAAPAA
jgi:CRP-like cAMP-binding protein